MEALCHKRGLCSDDHGSVLFVQVCVCVHTPICVLHSLAKPAAAFLNHHLYAATHVLLKLSDSWSTCLSPLHLLFFFKCVLMAEHFTCWKSSVLFSPSPSVTFTLWLHASFCQKIECVCMQGTSTPYPQCEWVSERVCVYCVCLCVTWENWLLALPTQTPHWCSSTA